MRVPRPAVRVVSLVPSLTESVAAARPDALVGATDWCTHPPGLPVTRVRGTKNPDRAAIAALRPDIVLANQEENRRLDVERLRAAGIDGVGDRHPDPGRGGRLAAPDVHRRARLAGATLAGRCERTLGVNPHPAGACAWPSRSGATRGWSWDRPPSPATSPPGSGLDNVYGGHQERYPHVSLPELTAREPELIVLPDEPYPFSADDGPEVFPGRRVALVEGRSLTWYGPSLIDARSKLTAQVEAARLGTSGT